MYISQYHYSYNYQCTTHLHLPILIHEVPEQLKHEYELGDDGVVFLLAGWWWWFIQLEGVHAQLHVQVADMVTDRLYQAGYKSIMDA